ncbi:MAG: dihydrolipoyllysine-residue acetyltransferase [Gammaproteobacteria bacterium]|nr:dihydrolipoyllysine-residue acetyltransferase [Gammaproteobacteria bacterium]
MSNIIDITIPDIGDVESVEIIEILVSVGDTVVTDDSLVTLESDKASMEVPATAAGVIKSLDVDVGATVAAGAVIGTLELIAASSDSSESPVEEVPAITPKQDEPPPVETTAEVKEPVDPPAADIRKTTTASPTAHLSDEQVTKAHASPGVRRYAREHGAALNVIKGTGPKGRILKEDVRLFIKESLESSAASYGNSPASGAGIPAIPAVDFTRFGEIERVELSRINRVSAENLHRAWLNIPMVTHHESADVTEMEAFRKTLKGEAREGDPKVTGLAFHMKALVTTLKEFPKVNSSLAPDGKSLFYKKYYHVGIAVDTPNGLVVPVFRDVDKKSINDLAMEMSDVGSRARAKKLKPDEMQGASMTISSLGGIGGTAFSPIINPPEVAILGISRATMQPVWDGEAFQPRLMCPLALTYDHRVVDGADAARFMVFYRQVITDIRRLLL